jgi:hypothetical protein
VKQEASAAAAAETDSGPAAAAEDQQEQQQQDDLDQEAEQQEQEEQQEDDDLPELTGQLKWLYHLTSTKDFFKPCKHCSGARGGEWPWVLFVHQQGSALGRCLYSSAQGSCKQVGLQALLRRTGR